MPPCVSPTRPVPRHQCHYNAVVGKKRKIQTGVELSCTTKQHMHAVCQCNYFELLAQLRVGLNLGAYNVASGDGGDANCWRNTRSKRAFAYSRRAKKCPLAPPIRPSQCCHAARTAAYHYPNPCSYSLSCGSNPRCCSMSVQWGTSNASYCRQHDVCLCSDWGMMMLGLCSNRCLSATALDF